MYLTHDPMPYVADGHAHIEVRGGFFPETVVTRAGRPLRLTFTRQETWPCSDRVVFSDFGISVGLPPHRDVTVDLLPEAPGEYGFTCGTSLLEGRLIVQPA